MKEADKMSRFVMTILPWVMLTVNFTHVFGQESLYKRDSINYRFEIEVGTDNDLFVAYTHTDKYYTYGLNLGLRYVPYQENFLRRVALSSNRYFFHFSINLKAYTPNYLENTPEQTLRRPFAGWLYGEFSTIYTFGNAVFKMGLQAGVLGPAARAGDIQNWVHEHISGDRFVDGWDEQIPNQAGINMVTSYSRKLLGTMDLWDSYLTVSAAVGNIYTYFWPQFNFRIGRFLPISQSISLNNAILSPPDGYELFFEIGPGVKLTAYDATLQGNLFKEDTFLNAEEVNNMTPTAQMSINYLKKRWSGKISYHYSAGDITNGDSHFFGRILLAYRL